MKITATETVVLQVPFTHGGPPTGFGGTIWTTMDVLVLRVDTDEGLSGYGEAFGYGILPAVRAALDTLVGPLVVGRDSSRVRALSGEVARTLHLFGRGGAAMFAVSAVDLALWDLAGKRAGLPVAQLLGGSDRASVPAYASLFRLTDPDLVARESARAVEGGYGEVKLHEVLPANVAVARQAVGDGVGLMVDVNCAWSRGEAVEQARAMRPYALTWLEEPVWPPEDHAALRVVREEAGVPVAAGENAGTPHEFLSLATTGRCDFVQPSMTKSGGLTGSVLAAELAASAGSRLAPHSPYFGPGLLATLQLAALFPEVRSVEHLYARLEAPLYGDVGVPGPDGRFAIPTAPGLGADLDPEVLRRYRAA